MPSALSIFGFDDLELSRQWRPALTIVHVPTERMWALAAEYLLDRVDGRLAEPLRQEVAVELIVRASSAPPGGRAE